MSNIRLDDTITAISTPVGEGGIGIVRLSGRDSLKIADSIFVPKNGKKPSSFKTYTVHYGHIIGKKGQVIDEVILTIMRSPRSYTKEDVIEVNCHSGIAPLRKILDLVLKNGARLAEPGEFTKRAFLNGRIDILQAESVLDIIRSKTDLSLKAALNNLEGLFSKKIEEISLKLMDILARLEASIDFSEEDDVDTIDRKKVLSALKMIDRDIEKFILNAREGRILRQGVNTVICGSPNVGKSSLMNAILKESRVIVTHLPGTTRDSVEELVNIKGVPVVLVDTAGINDTDHPVEKEGIKKSHYHIQKADLKLLVLDYGRRLNKKEIEMMRSIREKDNIIIVVNKKDLKKEINMDSVRKIFPKKDLVYVSAVNLSGIDKLENKIKDVIFKGKAPSADLVTASNDRQLDILRRSLEDVKAAIASFKNNEPLDLVITCLRSSVESLGEVIGCNITEETLDRIFSEFCIGK
ncbi:tRNA uridine-5-carboxymethylaminomethyl(34) synthesis GTPase MnmE [Candidatus Omnitrophota bacterium]